MSVSELPNNDAVIVVEFNDAINRRDLLRLTELMAPEHRFIDSTGTTVSGRDACMNAWQGFFASFSDYRNIFDDVAAAAFSPVFCASWAYTDDFDRAPEAGDATRLRPLVSECSRIGRPQKERPCHTSNADCF